jgi:hypothetical protein
LKARAQKKKDSFTPQLRSHPNFFFLRTRYQKASFLPYQRYKEKKSKGSLYTPQECTLLLFSFGKKKLVFGSAEKEFSKKVELELLSIELI